MALQAGALSAAWLSWLWAGSPELSLGGTDTQTAPGPTQGHHGGTRGCSGAGTRRCHPSTAWHGQRVPARTNLPCPALPGPALVLPRPGPVPAGQLVTRLVRLALSSRICSRRSRGGWAGVFRSEAASSTGGKFPSPHQDFNCAVTQPPALPWRVQPRAPHSPSGHVHPGRGRGAGTAAGGSKGG